VIEGDPKLKEQTSRNSTQSADVQIARLEMMLEVSQTLNSTLDLDVLLQSIIDVATELTETEAASILLLDERKGGLHFQAVTGVKRGQVEAIVVPLEGSIAGWIVKSGESLVIYNIQKDERHFSDVDRLTKFTTRAILGVPLLVKNRTIGVIEVLNKKNEADFTGSDIQILTNLATQAAIAIENARLFRQNDQLVNIFHELRSPMTSIIGFSRIILSSPDIDVDDVRLGLESINREATRLSQIVNDFLDLAKIETGRIYMNKELVDLESLTKEVIDMFYPLAREKEITFVLQVNQTLPRIPADRDRLKQVVINLLDNAIKYGYQGGEVTVSLSCQGGMRVLCAIKDTGRGIGPQDLELVFDKFYRIQMDNEEKIRGAGLGLALAKKIIEAHGGDIWVESEVEVGSTFAFSLPLQEEAK
jgi:signal transduction histidine kinase